MSILNLEFTSPEFFLLIIPIFLLIIYFYKKNKNELEFFCMEDLKEIYIKDSFFYKLKFLIITFIFINFIIILSNPISEKITEKIKKRGIDIEIVLDVSYSMIATDLKPTRLDVAKEVINNFLDKIKTDRVGIIVFSGKPFTSIPLTFDYNILKETIKNINIGIINQNNPDFAGTAMGDALLLAKLAFKKNNNREKVIILLTDGEANKGLEPLLALKLLKEEKIKVYTIGIGGKEKTTILIPTLFGKQLMEIGGVDEITLEKIANETSGKYFKADDKKTFEEIFKEISLLEKNDIFIEQSKTQENKKKIFLFLLILSMISLSFLIYKKG